MSRLEASLGWNRDLFICIAGTSNTRRGDVRNGAMSRDTYTVLQFCLKPVSFFRVSRPRFHHLHLPHP
jgi:hypothetical protein